MSELRTLILYRLSVGMKKMPEILPSANLLDGMRELDRLVHDGLVVQREAADEIFWNYYLTPLGEKEIEREWNATHVQI